MNQNEVTLVFVASNDDANILAECKKCVLHTSSSCYIDSKDFPCSSYDREDGEHGYWTIKPNG
jgi:hypothetical protein